MKKQLLMVWATALLIPLSANAQLPAKPNIDLGVKVGANFAQLKGDSWEKTYNPNFLAGFFGGFRFKKFGVQVEGFVSRTKYTTTGKDFYYKYKDVIFRPTTDSSRQARFNVAYINIPVLLQFKLLPMLWLQAGPQYSGIVNITDADKLVTDTKKLFKSNDFAGVIGLEAKLPVKLVFGARYLFGLSSLNGTSSAGSWQRNTIQVHAGLSLL